MHKWLAVILLVFIGLSSISSSAAVEGFYSRESSGFLHAVFYYGWLSTSNLLEIDMDILVVSGTIRVLPGGPDRYVVDALLARGVEVFAYIHDNTNGSVPVGLGSLYNDTVAAGLWSVDEYVAYVNSLIDQYVGNFTGVFLDECDPAYFNTTDPNDPLLIGFTGALESIVDYAHSKGLKVFINGVRGYAGLGDYYLWELFLTRIDPGTGDVVLDNQFLETYGDSNPYNWTSGMTKLSYLAANGLLDRTIALTIIPEGNLTVAEVAYYTARILGLAGWGYSDIYINALGGPINPVRAYTLGPLIESRIDTVNASLYGVFAAGPVSVDISGMDYETPYVGLGIPLLDAVLDNLYNVSIGPWSGSKSVISEFAVYPTVYGIYLWYNITVQNSTSLGIMHLYIDTDNNSTTGYQVSGLGADKLVEIYRGGTALLFAYNGTGTTWDWDIVGSVAIALNTIDNQTYRIELELPPTIASGNASILAATLVNWSVDATAPTIQIDELRAVPPTIFTKTDNAEVPLIKEVTYGNTITVIVAEAPSGTLALYTVYLPYKNVSRVLANNTLIPRVDVLPVDGQAYNVSVYDGMLRLKIQVKHNSPIIIKVLPPAVVGGKLVTPDTVPLISWGTLAVTIIILALLSVKNKKLVSTIKSDKE